MAVKVAVGLVLLIYAFSCDALSVRSCLPKLSQDSCVLACCGEGSLLQPKATFLRDPSDNILVVQPDFTVPQCFFTNSARGEFKCNTSNNHRCQYEHYHCRIQQGSSTASARINVTLVLGPLDEAPSVPIPCLPPVIRNVAATKISDGNVVVTWDYSPDRGYKFCGGSRQFSVAYLQYESYSDGYNDATILTRQQYNFVEVGRRITEVNITGLNFDRYYRFLVKSRRGTGSPGDTEAVFSTLKHFAEEVPIEWREGYQMRRVKQGESVTMSCWATGVPTPTITHHKSGAAHTRNGGTLEFRNVKKGDDGLYVCSACHHTFDNQLGTRKEVCTDATIRLIVIPQQHGRDCVAYTGTQCFEYIHLDWKIFTSNRSLLTVDHISESDIEIPEKISEPCRLFIQSVLCHALLPYCNPFTLDDGGYAPLPICHRTCLNLEARCGGEIELHGQRFSKYLWKNCKTERNDTGDDDGPGDKPGCIFVDPDHPLKGGPDSDTLSLEQATTECKLNTGQSYRGHQSYTGSGLPCQKWSSQWPNQHQFTKMMGGELETASKFCRNPGGLGERPWCFVNNVERRWEYCDIPDCEQCVPYTGDFCREIGYNLNMSVFFSKMVKDSIADMELELRGKLHSLQDDLTPGCELVALQLLCYGALPICNNDTTQSLCEQHCHLYDLLELCPSNLKKMIHSISYLNLTACKNHMPLPPPTVTHCLPDPVLLNATGKDQQRDSCLDESTLGHTYTGNLSVTEAHMPCLSWSRHPHRLMEGLPELNGAYCRNPGQFRKQPWCYTSTAGEWDYCNVSLCSATAASVVTDVVGSSDNPDSTIIVSLLSVITFGVLITLVIVAVCVGYCFYKKRATKGNPVCVEPHVSNATYFTHTLMSPATVKLTKTFRQIEKSKIKYIKQLGQGNFGIVFEGECEWLQRNNEEGGEPTKVAVKTLKLESSKDAIEAFVREAKLLHLFAHPHIVKFYGVCMDDLPFYMVFEFMDRGDLCQFLREHSSSSQRRYNPPVQRERLSSSVSNDSATLGASELLDICKQIANGMAYLESMNHIHRDLACRNCLVSSGMVVKIADFGMSQNLYSKDYYRVSGEASLPVRWMPPESIIYGTFSTKGDMWSFGVVVWEIFSFGMQPYWGFPNDTVVEMIRKGTLLEKPEACPDKLYSLIKGGCWGMYENERMLFATLDRTLRDFRLSDSDISLSLDMDSLHDMVFDDGDSISNVANDDDKED